MEKLRFKDANIKISIFINYNLILYWNLVRRSVGVRLRVSERVIIKSDIIENRKEKTERR